MKRNLALATAAAAVLVAAVIMGGRFWDAGTSENDQSGTLSKSRSRNPREPGFREKLILDADGNLVAPKVFEANLKLDDSFTKDSGDYRMKLLVNYIELALRANPDQALVFLRERHDEWSGDPLVAPTIMRAIASTLGLEAIREFLDVIPSRDVMTNIVTGLSLDLKGWDPLAMVDFFLGYDASLLANEAVMANLMLQADGGIEKLTEVYFKLPNCAERTAAARVLAQRASTLNADEFGKFYKGISQNLSKAELQEMHSQLATKMDSLDDPKLAILLADGYRGDPTTLATVATSAADISLDDALRKLRSLDLHEEDRNAIFSGIMRSWAQYAPLKAAQYAYSSYQSGDADAEGMNTVFGEWIARDTPEAVSYFNRLGLDANEKRLLDLSHFPNVASYSLEDGLALLQERQNDPDYHPTQLDQMRRDFALTDAAHHTPQVVIGEMAKIQDPRIRDSSFFRFSSALASENLFKAVSLAAETTVPSQRDQMLLGALAPAISYDISYGHDMIRHISDPRRRDDAYMQWYDIARKTEPHLAAKWLRDLSTTNPQIYETIYK